MRVLVVTNLVPDETTPQRGRWVRDQVAEIRARGIEVEEFGFPRGRSHYLPATRRLRALLRAERFDLVHAHYGLAGWVARLAGARPLLVTFHGTDVRHHIVGPLSRRLAWRADLIAGVSRALFFEEDGRPGLPAVPGAAVLPCGPELGRFASVSRAEARAALGLDPAGRYLLFPADPARPEKRHDRAAELAATTGAELLTGGSIEPEAMATWMNAANAVLVTSDYEGFGMAAIEALACDVPVLSTPVGVAPYLLAGIDGCLCAPFDPDIWAAAARPQLDSADPRVAGAARAATLAAGPLAERVIEVYRHMTARRV
jgi:glycosyltransferase involved in cell wall biosynthesis